VSDQLRTNLLRALALLIVIGTSIFFISIRDQIARFTALGYPGIFLITLISNASVLLPIPGTALVFTTGSIFNPFFVAIAAGLGGGLGEISGYLAGFSGQAVIERFDVYNKIAPWIEKYETWGVFLLACIPNPFFDAVGIAAGVLKMPFHKFLIAAICGNIIKMSLFAFAGAYSIDWLMPPPPH
jgi:uncharacterized membrane protein YdjX (TVP38/TMEM64 family)